MEYDHVTIADDFINEERLIKQLKNNGKSTVDRRRLSEEINLVYVAVTRSRNFLDFPRAMFPRADKNDFAKTKIPVSFFKKRPGGKKSWPVTGKRREFENACKPWPAEQDGELREMFVVRQKPLSEIALHFDSNIAAIRSRLRRLGMMGDFDTRGTD